MIVDGKLSIPRLFRDLSKPLMLLFVISSAIAFLYEKTHSHYLSISATPLTVIGVALSIFLAFRNNTVYSRWWEGRVLWGALINQSRTLARQLFTFPTAPIESEESGLDEWRRAIILRHIGYIQILRRALRSEEPLGENVLVGLVSAEEIASYRVASNIPAAILHRQGEELHRAWRQGWLREYHLTALDETLREVTNAQGGCERIKNTPVPPVYTHLAYRLIITYCCFVPFGLIEDMRFLTPLITILIGFAFLVLDHISQLIEMPFSTDANDLPLTAMARTIEIDLRERIGATPIPAPIAPKDGILL